MAAIGERLCENSAETLCTAGYNGGAPSYGGRH